MAYISRFFISFKNSRHDNFCVKTFFLECIQHMRVVLQDKRYTPLGIYMRLLEAVDASYQYLSSLVNILEMDFIIV